MPAQPAQAAKKTPPDSPRTIKRNGGTLRVGNPGNKGGGRPKDRVRQMLLGNLEEAVPVLHQLAMVRDAEGAIVDQEFLLKYVGTIQQKALPNEKEVSVDNVRERVQRTLAIIGQHCPPELAESLYQAIEPVWR